MAEFLYESVENTIDHIIPEEIRWLQNYETFKREVDDEEISYIELTYREIFSVYPEFIGLSFNKRINKKNTSNGHKKQSQERAD